MGVHSVAQWQRWHGTCDGMQISSQNLKFPKLDHLAAQSHNCWTSNRLAAVFSVKGQPTGAPVDQATQLISCWNEVSNYAPPDMTVCKVSIHLSGPQERNFSFCGKTFLTQAFATWKKQQFLLSGTHNPFAGTLITNIQRPSLWHSQLIMPVRFHALSRPFPACILASALVSQFCANSCGVCLWPSGFCDVDEAFGALIMSPTMCGMDWSLRHRCECQEEASYLQTVPQCLLIFHLPKAASCEYTKKRLTQNIMNELIQVPWSLAGQTISRIFCFCHKPLYADSMPCALPPRCHTLTESVTDNWTADFLRVLLSAVHAWSQSCQQLVCRLTSLPPNAWKSTSTAKTSGLLQMVNFIFVNSLNLAYLQPMALSGCQHTAQKSCLWPNHLLSCTLVLYPRGYSHADMFHVICFLVEVLEFPVIFSTRETSMHSVGKLCNALQRSLSWYAALQLIPCSTKST